MDDHRSGGKTRQQQRRNARARKDDRGMPMQAEANQHT